MKSFKINIRGIFHLLRPFVDPEVLRTIQEDFKCRASYELENTKTLKRIVGQTGQFLVILFSVILESLLWSVIMFKNYVKTGMRNFRKHKAFSLINICGLAVGLACCLLILLYVKNELSYDRSHKNAGNIYRVIMDQRWNPMLGKTLWNVTPGAAAPTLKQDFPEVILATRLTSRRILVTVGDKIFNERNYYVEPDFLKIFTFPLLSGNPDTALAEPYSILITQEMNQKYFGNEDPMGKVINVNKNLDFRVTGVLENIPENSHLQFNFLASYSSLLESEDSEYLRSWRSNSPQAYIMLLDGFDPDLLQAKLPAFIRKYKGEDTKSDFVLQPLTRIQLYSTHIHDATRGDIKHIYFLTAIALIIMAIACLNYINLSTARASTRIKEVGMRKVIGADRSSLIQQFLGESVTYSLLAFVAAMGMSWLFLPTFNSLIRRNLHFSQLFDLPAILIMAALVIIIGLASGGYPAVYLSSFQPSSILQRKYGMASGKSSLRLRSVLVISQFSLSIILIVCTLVVGKQLSFMRSKDLGFYKEAILNVNIQDPNIRKTQETLKSRLIQHPGIIDILVTENLPTTISSNSRYTNPTWAGKKDTGSFYLNWGWVDYGFFDFFGIELLEGRKFSKEFATDRKAFIINETAARIIGWEAPVGKVIKGDPVIGVVKDFHFRPLRNEIEPVALSLSRGSRLRYFSIKIRGEQLEETISSIEKTWNEHSPGYPFSFSFLDESLDRMYRSEKLLLKIFNHFALLAILLSCLGLLGLAFFNADRRTKEIGIRKVLGASMPQILFLLSREFTKWVILANLISWPLAYYIMSRWLRSFAYSTDFAPWIFLSAGCLSLALSVFIVAYQSIKAALADPVESLRYE